MTLTRKSWIWEQSDMIDLRSIRKESLELCNIIHRYSDCEITWRTSLSLNASRVQRQRESCSECEKQRKLSSRVVRSDVKTPGLCVHLHYRGTTYSKQRHGTHKGARRTRPAEQSMFGQCKLYQGGLLSQRCWTPNWERHNWTIN